MQPQNFDEAYYIDSVPVVRVWPLNPGGANYPNLFVGARAGLNVGNVGTALTFVGSHAGFSNTTGGENTFVGHEAGINNTSGQSNAFVGSDAGSDNTSGSLNAFFGTLSGQNNTTGSQNVAIGDRAYSSGTISNDNTAIGFNSGINLNNGSNNLFAGSGSAFAQTTGNNNVSLGFNAGSTFLSGEGLTLVGASAAADDGLTNAGALGQGAWVRNSDDLILGNINTFVGIGLSGDATGATAPLEINTSGANLSGLRFRDLNILSPVSVTGITKVLTLDIDGDVIWGEIPIGTGPITACSSPGLTTNYITKASASTQICRSQVYDDGTSVGVGVGASPNTAMKLHMQGDMYVQHNAGAGTPVGGDIFMNDASGNVQRIISMYGTGGFGAISLGHFAGNSQTLGNSGSSISASVFVGREAGRNIAANSAYNTFVGSEAGENLSASTGNSNTIVGSVAGHKLADGEKNVMIGFSAGNGSGSDTLTDGDFNVFIGAEVQNNTLRTSTRNVVIGSFAAAVNDMNSTVAADRNVVIGHGAIAQDVVGSGGPNEITNAVIIGAGGQVYCDSCFVLGNRFVHRVGIGTNQPSSSTMLDVKTRTGMSWAAIFRDTAIQVNTVHVASDIMLKEQIQPVSGISNLLSNLNVYNYKYKKQDFPQVGIDGGFHFGLMAQEVEQHFPLLVSSNTAGALYDSTGQESAPSVDYKSINMLEFVPLLIQGFNEQKSAMDNLQQQINDLTQQLNNCCAQPLINDGDTQNNKASLVLSNKETIILNQNAPNPFKDKTEIGYNIPQTVGDAVILFYDQSGKVLQKFEISHRGAGSLIVYGEDLSSGAYTYSLIIDGENHQTKRMVKQ